MAEKRKAYSFTADPHLMAEGMVMAKQYRVSFNLLLTLLLENAVEEWSVPGMEPQSRTPVADGDGKEALTNP